MALKKIEASILSFLDEAIRMDAIVNLGEIDGLTEEDEILRIRELVDYLEVLSKKNYLSLEEGYYEENDFVVFKYNNNAISIDLSKIKITQKALDELNKIKMVSKSRINRRLMMGTLFITSFLSGMIIMHLLLNF